jgi:hypothetical protein
VPRRAAHAQPDHHDHREHVIALNDHDDYVPDDPAYRHAVNVEFVDLLDDYNRAAQRDDHYVHPGRHVVASAARVHTAVLAFQELTEAERAAFHRFAGTSPGSDA